MLFVFQIHRPAGLHYDEKNARHKKKKIREIEALIESQKFVKKWLLQTTKNGGIHISTEIGS